MRECGREKETKRREGRREREIERLNKQMALVT